MFCMKKDETVFLEDILAAIRRIEKYLNGVSHQHFLQNDLLQDGVVRRLEIIGEASRNFSDDFHQRYSHVPWRQIVSLRNRMIHAYFNVNLQIVWEIVQNDLPILKQQVEDILLEERKN